MYSGVTTKFRQMETAEDTTTPAAHPSTACIRHGFRRYTVPTTRISDTVAIMFMNAPSGSVTRCGIHDVTATATPIQDPYKIVASSETMPDGSYFNHSAPGTTGSSTKLSTIAMRMSSTMAATCFGERSCHPQGKLSAIITPP